MKELTKRGFTLFHVTRGKARNNQDSNKEGGYVQKVVVSLD